jgi:methionine sulfoxide reductase heme-binding subunit
MSSTDRRTLMGLDRDHLTWAVMALPALYMIGCGAVGAKIPYVAWSGIVACWFIVLAMLVTPAMMLSKSLLWLKPRRRYFGVAGFCYSLLHLAFWIAHIDLTRFMRSFVRPELVVGWAGLAIFVPLAITSYDGAVRALGPRWKTLQRWVYAAAFLTLVHWLMTADDKTIAVASSLPVIILSVWRLARWRLRSART